jgi:hypothetical protein
VPIVILIGVLVVLGGIVVVAVGRGGELTAEPPDYAPLDMGPVSATDVVLLRPPTALWGYNVQVTDDALERIAAAIRERDVRIVALEQRVADLTGDEHYAPIPASARQARRASAAVTRAPEAPARDDTSTETLAGIVAASQERDWDRDQQPEDEAELGEADEADE